MKSLYEHYCPRVVAAPFFMVFYVVAAACLFLSLSAAAVFCFVEWLGENRRWDRFTDFVMTPLDYCFRLSDRIEKWLGEKRKVN